MRWLGFWTLLGVVSGAQLHLANQRFAVHPPSWWLALATGLSHWYLWGLLALVVAWLGRRFQVDRASFGRQKAMALIGASLATVAPGAVEIALPFRDDLTQQKGFVHGGIIGMIADTACGYAAYPPRGASQKTHQAVRLAQGKCLQDDGFRFPRRHEQSARRRCAGQTGTRRPRRAHAELL